MLLSAKQLLNLIDTEVIEDGMPELVNSASIDIRLGRNVLVEERRYHEVSLRHKDVVKMRPHDLVVDGPIVLHPGDFILAHSIETFNLPNHISAEYRLKSSMARIGLDHLNAGWCDAGWHGSVLTLELKNVSNYASIILNFEDKIGQMLFFEHEEVPMHMSYAMRGRYNKNSSVSGVRPDPKHRVIYNELNEDITDEAAEEFEKDKALFAEFLEFKRAAEAAAAEVYDEVNAAEPRTTLSSSPSQSSPLYSEAEENRMDLVGQNGPTGLHYPEVDLTEEELRNV